MDPNSNKTPHAIISNFHQEESNNNSPKNHFFDTKQTGFLSKPTTGFQSPTSRVVFKPFTHKKEDGNPFKNIKREGISSNPSTLPNSPNFTKARFFNKKTGQKGILNVTLDNSWLITKDQIKNGIVGEQEVNKIQKFKIKKRKIASKPYRSHSTGFRQQRASKYVPMKDQDERIRLRDRARSNLASQSLGKVGDFEVLDKGSEIDHLKSRAKDFEKTGGFYNLVSNKRVKNKLGMFTKDLVKSEKQNSQLDKLGYFYSEVQDKIQPKNILKKKLSQHKQVSNTIKNEQISKYTKLKLKIFNLRNKQNPNPSKKSDNYLKSESKNQFLTPNIAGAKDRSPESEQLQELEEVKKNHPDEQFDVKREERFNQQVYKQTIKQFKDHYYTLQESLIKPKYGITEEQDLQQTQEQEDEEDYNSSSLSNDEHSMEEIPVINYKPLFSIPKKAQNRKTTLSMKESLRNYQTTKNKKKMHQRKTWDQKLEVALTNKESAFKNTGYDTFNSRYYNQDFSRERASTNGFKKFKKSIRPYNKEKFKVMHSKLTKSFEINILKDSNNSAIQKYKTKPEKLTSMSKRIKNEHKKIFRAIKSKKKSKIGQNFLQRNVKEIINRNQINYGRKSLKNYFVFLSREDYHAKRKIRKQKIAKSQNSSLLVSEKFKSVQNQLSKTFDKFNKIHEVKNDRFMIRLSENGDFLSIFKYFAGNQIGDALNYSLNDFFNILIINYTKLKRLFVNEKFLEYNLQQYFQSFRLAKCFFFDSGKK